VPVLDKKGRKSLERMLARDCSFVGAGAKPLPAIELTAAEWEFIADAAQAEINGSHTPDPRNQHQFPDFYVARDILKKIGSSGELAHKRGTKGSL
jgi:hypothetical protein